MKFFLLSGMLLLAGPGTALAQLVDGVYRTKRHVAFEGELFRFSGQQFVYEYWTDVGSFGGTGRYKVAADTLRLYFQKPALQKWGWPIDSGSVKCYQITKVRKSGFVLKSLRPYSLQQQERYHLEKGQTLLDIEGPPKR